MVIQARVKIRATFKIDEQQKELTTGAGDTRMYGDALKLVVAHVEIVLGHIAGADVLAPPKKPPQRREAGGVEEVSLFLGAPLVLVVVGAPAADAPCECAASDDAGDNLGYEQGDRHSGERM